MGKHKHIKSIDPFLAGPRREKKIRDQERYVAKLDVAPRNSDEQGIPKSYRTMLELMDDMNKTWEEKQKERKEARDTKLKERQLGEDARKETKQQSGETKYKISGKAAKSAKIKNQDHKMKLLMEGPHDPLAAKKKKISAKKKKRRLAVMKKAATHKKVEKDLDKLEKDFFKDNVPFGEVVQAPPQLTSKPRGGKASDNKSGSRQLHLTSIFSKGDLSSNRNQSGNSRKLNKKRKSMTMHEKMVFDERQSAAVDAYKKLKKQRMSAKRIVK